LSNEKLQEIINVLIKKIAIHEGDSSTYKLGGKAHMGMSRAEALQKTKDELKRANKLEKEGKKSEAEKLRQRAYNRRDKMEKLAREKQNEELIREVVRKVLAEKKRKASSANEKTLKNKAEESGYTYGSLKTEFEKGLGAYYSSGSRPGMTPQQWAFARVNKCIKSNPSWCNIKKSSAKK
jgi:hypothetical protein